MKFNLIDRIESITDERIVAVKYVSLAEEYLADHFPTFPVLPGVMMLEVLTQAAGWLLYRRSNFAKSIAVLKEARNVKYGNFVAPGNSLRVEVDFFKPTDTGAVFKAAGIVNETQALSARIELSYFNLSDKTPEMAPIDKQLIDHTKSRWNMSESSREIDRNAVTYDQGQTKKDLSMTREEIYDKVKAVMVDALGVDEDEVKPESVIRDDLGAESIDFLDIMFRLEKSFNIKIPRGEMMPENLVSDPTLVQDGKVTPKGLAMLKERMPFATNFSDFEKDPELEKMSKLFTVEMIVNFVEWKLANPTTETAAPTEFPSNTPPASGA